MTKDAIAHRLGQVQSDAVLLELVNNPKALLVVPESGNDCSHRPLPGMTEWRVAKIMTHADRLDQVLVEPQCSPDGTGDLGNFERVRQAGANVISAWTDEHLRLVHEPSEALGVDDSVPVVLEGSAEHGGWLPMNANCIPAASGQR